jgi:ABC-type Fe3+/spermidine/putrescine transport system ATPase subunit
MREEIRRVHDETRITTVYVTHDQKEALSLADRMALMHRGRVVQVGSPHDIYRRPTNRFVASFLGDANLIDGTIAESQGGSIAVDTPIGRLVGTASAHGLRVGSAVLCCVRPEAITLEPPSNTAVNRVRARIEREVFLGEVRHVHLTAGSTSLTCFRLHGPAPRAAGGSEVDCVFAPDSVVVVPRDNEGGDTAARK